MPRYYPMYKLLHGAHQDANRLQDEARREAIAHARQRLQENTARLKLTETRRRVGGWS